MKVTFLLNFSCLQFENRGVSVGQSRSLEQRMQKLEMHMLRYTSGWGESPREIGSGNKHVKGRLRMANTKDKMREHSLRWFGNKMRSEEDLVKDILRFRVEGWWDRGRPKLTRKQVVRTDMAMVRIDGGFVKSRRAWKAAIRRPDPATSRKSLRCETKGLSQDFERLKSKE